MSLMTKDTKSELEKLTQNLGKQADFVYKNVLGVMYSQQQGNVLVLISEAVWLSIRKPLFMLFQLFNVSQASRTHSVD